MKLATFNVNSLKIRLPVVLDWLSAHQPDVLMLQELKGLELPEADITAAGYHIQAVPQKAYNGVTTLTKTPSTVVATSLLPGDEQARFLSVDYQGVRVINIYAPNGNPITDPARNENFEREEAKGRSHPVLRSFGPSRENTSDKFFYKLHWLAALYDHLKELRAQRIDFVIAGDFNIIPADIDAANPKNWMNDALFQPESRALYRSFLHLGLYDAIRALHPQPGIYTFWDYQAGAWPRNDGIRIDHILLSPKLADKLVKAEVDKAPRALEKPSDHTPVWVEINI